jgi:hypothetical protein
MQLMHAFSREPDGSWTPPSGLAAGVGFGSDPIANPGGSMYPLDGADPPRARSWPNSGRSGALISRTTILAAFVPAANGRMGGTLDLLAHRV